MFFLNLKTTGMMTCGTFKPTILDIEYNVSSFFYSHKNFYFDMNRKYISSNLLIDTNSISQPFSLLEYEIIQ